MTREGICLHTGDVQLLFITLHCLLECLIHFRPREKKEWRRQGSALWHCQSEHCRDNVWFSDSWWRQSAMKFLCLPPAVIFSGGKCYEMKSPVQWPSFTHARAWVSYIHWNNKTLHNTTREHHSTWHRVSGRMEVHKWELRTGSRSFYSRGAITIYSRKFHILSSSGKRRLRRKLHAH